jgi:hypothetical protein
MAPRKWLGRKGGLLIVALGAVLWFGNVLFEVAVFHVNEAPTGSLIIGAFTVASAFIYTMAYRLQPARVPRRRHPVDHDRRADRRPRRPLVRGYER